MSSDRNELLGVLAVRLGFLTPDQLTAGTNDWRPDGAKSLGLVLRERGHLSPARLRLLDELVAEHLEMHGDDPAKCLAALSSVASSVDGPLAVANTLPQHEFKLSTATRPFAGAGDTLPARPVEWSAGRYRVVRTHAKGGLGEVFVAEDTELGRHVALKQMQRRYADVTECRLRFVVEAEITGGLEHPGIVPVYGLGRHADGRPFYAMRFIQGDTLQDAIRRIHAPGSPDFVSLEFRDLLRRFLDVCNAIAYAHSRGVLHRDLKPANVMLGQFGETLVVDWGLAKATGRADCATDSSLLPRSGGDSAATVAGQAIGTPAYMSPEQADGRLNELGPTTDVYSLGATLYELLTGQVAFVARTIDDVVAAVRAGRFRAPRAVLPTVPPPLEAVCLKAMARDPAGRYASVAALARDVERWLGDEAVAAYPDPPAARLRRWARRHARLTAGAAAALVIGSLAIGAIAWQSERARRDVEREQAATALERDAKEAERAKAAAERDRALAARARTRETLNAVTSSAALEAVTAKADLSAAQREFLDKLLVTYQEFADDAADDPAGAAGLAAASLSVGRLRQALGVPGSEDAFVAAVNRYRHLMANDPTNPRHREGLSLAVGALGYFYYALGRSAQADPHLREALVLCTARTAAAPDDRTAATDLAHALSNLATVTFYTNKSEAETLTRQAVAMLRRLDDGTPAARATRSQEAVGVYNLGILLDSQNRRREAEAAFRESLAAWRKLTAESPATTRYRRGAFLVHVKFGKLLSEEKRWPEAVAELRAAQMLGERLVGDYPAIPDYAAYLGECYELLGTVAMNQHDPAAAFDWFARAVKTVEPAANGGRLLLVAEVYYGAAEGAATAAEQLGRHRDVADWLAKLEGQDPHGRYDAEISTRRALALARSGQSSAANELLGGLVLAPAGPDDLVRVARAWAVAGWPDRAVPVLRRALAAGYRDGTQLLADAELASMRGRADYVDLLWEIADAPPK